MTQSAIDLLVRQYRRVFLRCRWLNAIAFSAATLLGASSASGQAIVPDGRTQTQVVTQGSTTDVTTETVRGRHAYNSFKRFNVDQGHTTNLHLPQGTANLLNLVRDEATHIDGILNAYKDGRIGGNVFFLNPHGIVVGESGVLNVGSLTLMTPKPQFMDGIISPSGAIDLDATQQVMDGQVPLTESGLISVRGEVRAREEIDLQGGRVIVGAGGSVQAGPVAVAELGDVVNVEGMAQADSVAMVDGVVRIYAAGDVEIDGSAVADGAAGRDGGQIDVRSGGDITVGGSATVSASGRGVDSAGGEVVVFAGRDATLRDGARLAATGGTSGDGGFVEFSAERAVHLDGFGLYAGAVAGDAGSILIDPDVIELTGSGDDMTPNDGSSITLQADERITLDNVLLSSRQVADDTRSGHLTGESTGDSGDITLEAPTIELTNGSMLLAHAIDPAGGPDYAGGTVTLTALKTLSPEIELLAGSTAVTRDQSASILMTLSTVMADDVNISSKIKVGDELFDFDALTDWAVDDEALTFLGDWLQQITALPFGFYLAEGMHSSVTMSGATIEAADSVTIDSEADVLAKAFAKGSLASAALAWADLDSTVTLSNGTQIDAGGAVNIHSDVITDVHAKATNTKNLGTKLGPQNSAIAFSVAYTKATSTIDVQSGTSVQGGADVTIVSGGEIEHESSAQAGSGLEGAVALTVSVSLTDIQIENTIDGEVISESSDGTARQVEIASRLTMSEEGEAGAGLAPNVIANMIVDGGKYTNQLNSLFGSSVKGPLNDPNRVGSPSSLSLAGGFAFMDSEKDVTTTVGGRVQATNAIDPSAGSTVLIEAKAENDVGNYALSRSQPREATASVGAAAGYLQITDNVSVDINSGAVIEADGLIDVKADLSYVDRLAKLLSGEFFNDLLEEKGEGLVELFDVAQQPEQLIFNTWAAAAVSGQGTNIGGNVNILDVEANTRVDVAAGASLRSGVNGTRGEMHDINLTSSVSLPMFHEAGDLVRPKQKPIVQRAWERFVGESGSQYNASSSGFTFMYQEYDVDSVVDVVDGASITADDLTAKATQDNFLFSFAIAGGAGQNVGVSGTFNYQSWTGLTEVTLGDGVVYDVDDLTLTADDKLDEINTTGAVGKGSSAAVGVSISYNDQQRTTRARLGEDAPTAVPTADLGIDGAVKLSALSKGTNYGFAVAGTLASGQSMGDRYFDQAVGDAPKQKGKFGLAFSGSVAFTDVDNLTEAVIGGVGLDLNDTVVLTASDTTDHLQVAGSVAIATSAAGQNSAGIAGAYSHNDLASTTEARIDHSRVDATGLTLDVDVDSAIFSLAAGLSGGGKVGVAGSVGFNTLGNTTEATLDQSTVTLTSGAVNLSAEDKSEIRAIAGAATFGGKAGFGAAVGYNELTGATRAQVLGGSVTGPGGVSLEAKSESFILSVSAALAASQQVSAAGSASINLLESTTEAKLEDATVTATGGDVTVDADDRSQIEAYTGGVAVSTGNAAVGVTGSFNELRNTVSATATGGRVEGDLVRFRARQADHENLPSEPDSTADGSSIFAVAAGGSGASKVGVTGSLAINLIENTIKAGSDGTTVISHGDIDAIAADLSKIESITGAVSGAGSAAIGASGSYNEIDNSVTASISGGSAEARAGTLTVDASRGGEIFAVAAGGSGAGTAGFAGSIAINTITGTTTAELAGGVDAWADGSLLVDANSDSAIQAIAGSVAIGGTVGIGGAVAVNDLDATTTAQIVGPGTTAYALGNETVTVVTGELDAKTGTSDSFVAPGVRTGDSLAERQQTESMRGVAVLASGTDQIDALSANVSGGGKVGVGATVNVNLVGGSTTAQVTGGATINDTAKAEHGSQEARVAAYHHTQVNSAAGGAAIGGAAGAGGAVDTSIISHTTTAEVNDAAVEAQDALLIDALSTTDVQSFVVGASIGGGGALQASVSTIKIEGTTEALADNADLESLGSLGIEAESEIDSRMVVGAASIGGGLGIGISAGVTLIDETTTAETLNDTTLDADGQTSILATSDKDLLTYGVTASLAGGTSIAGTGNVAIINGTTTARVGGSMDINQDSSFGGSGQHVHVKADDKLDIENNLGGLAIDLVGTGLGATADVVLVRNSAAAEVKSGARIDADGDIEVTADTRRELDTLTIAAGGGATVGIAGAVSVYDFGGTPSGDGRDQTAATVGKVDELTSGNAVEDQIDTDVDGAGDTGDKIDSQRGELAVEESYNAGPDADSFTAKAVVEAGTTLDAGGDVDVRATNQVDADGIAVGVAAGVGGGLGGGLIYGTVDDTTIAFAGGVIDADGSIDVVATDKEADGEQSHAQTWAGGAGIVGIGAAFSFIDNNSTAQAEVAANAELTADLDDNGSGNVLIDAVYDHDLRSETRQGAAGALGVGAAVAHGTLDGGATTSVGDDATLDGQNITVRSRVQTDIDSDSIAAAGGILAGVGSDARSDDKTEASTALGDGVQVLADGAATIRAQTDPHARAEALGAAISTSYSVGLSMAEADVDSTVSASTGSDVLVEGQTVDFSAAMVNRGGVNTADAEATAAVGGLLVGASATTADAIVTPKVTVTLGSRTKLDAFGDLSVFAITDADGDSETTGLTAGLLAGGANVSKTKIDSTTTTTLGVDVILESGDILEITADAKHDLFSETEAGAGGLGVLLAASAETDSDTDTDVVLLDGEDGYVTGATVDIRAKNHTVLDGEADSTNASVIGASGAFVSHDVYNNARVEIGTNVSMTAAGDLALSAINEVDKVDPGDYSVRSGAGGVASGSAAVSQSEIDNDANVYVGAGTVLRTLSVDDELHSILITALNDLFVRDLTQLDAGGALTGADARALLFSRNNNTRVELAGATLNSAGEIRINAELIGDARINARAKTYGLASASTGRSEIDLDATNRVILSGDADLFAIEDILIAAGDANPVSVDIFAYSDTRLWNKSALPLSAADAITNVRQDALVEVGADAAVRSVRDVHLAGVGSRVFESAYGLSKDLYSEAAEDVANFFGGIFGASPVSLDFPSGETSDTAIAGVRVDGLVDSGVYHRQILTIALDGSITATEGTGATVTDPQNIADAIDAEIERLERLAQTYGELPDVAEAFLAQARFLRERRDEARSRGLSIPFIDVQPTIAAAGNVFIDGDYLVGSGSIHAPGDALIQITNDSPFFLDVDSLLIPFEEGGRILFNEAAVTTNQDIAERNVAGFVPAFDDANLETAETSPAPLIEVVNTYDPDNFPPDEQALVPSEMWIGGDISNLGGKVTLDSIGSIVTSANIEASTIEIRTEGDFIKGFTFGFTHTGATIAPDGSDPDFSGEGWLNEVALDSEGMPIKFFVPGTGWVGAGAIPTRGTIDRTIATLGEIESSYDLDELESIIAGNNVFISAEKLNINGLIQSGIPLRTITITQDMIDNADLAQRRQQYQLAELFGLNPNPLSTVFEAQTGSEQITVRYNAETDRLELNPKAIRGGYMELFGDIFSTGNGELKVLDGYGRINIVNQTSEAIDIRRADAGSGAEGLLRITDTSKRLYQGNVFTVPQFEAIVAATPDVEFNDSASLVTEYRIQNGTAVARNNVTVDADGNPSNLAKSSADRTSTYDPTAGRRFVWLARERDVEEREVVFAKRSKTFFGADLGALGDWFAEDPGEKVSDRTFTVEDRAIVREGTTLIFDDNDNYYTYDFSEVTGDWRQIGDPTYTERCSDRDGIGDLSWCAEKEYKQTTVSQRGVSKYYRHSVSADETINIEFTGEDSGQVFVDSVGDVYLSGLVRAQDGTATIRSSGGSVIDTGDLGLIRAADVVLSAGHDIGTTATPVDLDTADTGDVIATAGGLVAINETSGDLRIGLVRSTGGDLRLFADRDIVNLNPSTTIEGNGILLEARNGGFGTMASPLRIDSDGVVNVDAATDVHLHEVAGDLRVEQIRSRAGSVSIRVSSGNLVDDNPEQNRDPVAEDALLGLWENAGLTGAAAEQSIENNVADVYQRYWTEERNLTVDDNGDLSFDPYDPNVAFSYDAAERQSLLDAGFNAQQIADQEAALTDAYRRIGQDAYSTDFRTDGTLATLAADTALDDVVSGGSWTIDELSIGISAALIKGTADTETRIEAPNVLGHQVTLDVSGQIGTNQSDIVVERTDTPATLTDEIKLALASAERDDVHVETDRVVIERKEDFDIALRDQGATPGSADVTATSHVFLGSEEDINVRAATGQEIRIKTGGGIFAGNDGGTPQLTPGQDLILEAADSSVGTATAPLLVDVPDGYKLIARGDTGVFIHEATGDINIGDMFSRGEVRLVAPGSIRDANRDRLQNIIAGSIDLTAQHGTIGESGDEDDYLDVELLDGGSLDAAADGGIFLLAPTALITLGDVQAGGNIDVIGQLGIDVVGLVDAGDDLTLRSDADLNIGQTPPVNGSTAPGSGEVGLVSDRLIELLADRDVRFNSALDVDSGQVRVEAGLGGGGSIFMADGASLIAQGPIAMHAADDVTLSHLQSTDGSDDAVRVTAIAGGIIDGGDSDAFDIEAELGQATLTAAAGVGHEDGLDIRVDRLEVEVTGDGDVNVWEWDALTDLAVRTTDGYINVHVGGDVPVSYLESGDAGDDEQHDIWISSEQSIIIDRIHADHDVFAVASRSLLAADASIRGGVIWLLAQAGDLGTETRRFTADTEGTLNLFALGDIHFTETAGDLVAAQAISATGTLDLTALDGSVIVDYLAAPDLTLDIGGSSQIGRIGGAETMTLPEPAGTNGEFNVVPLTLSAFSFDTGDSDAAAPQSLALQVRQEGGELTIDELQIGQRAELRADRITAGIKHVGDGEQLDLLVEGGEGRIAEKLDLNAGSKSKIFFEKLRGRKGELDADVTDLEVKEGFAGKDMQIKNKHFNVWVEKQDRDRRQHHKVQLFTPAGDFVLAMDENHLYTDAYIIHYDGTLLMNGVFRNEDSLTRLADKDLQNLLQRDENGNGSTAPGLPNINAVAQALGVDPSQLAVIEIAPDLTTVEGGLDSEQDAQLLPN